MPQLRYYTAQAVRDLWDNVPKKLDTYYGSSNLCFRDPIEADVRSSRLKVPDFLHLKTSTTPPPSSTDSANALIVYHELKELTLHQASDERLWVYLCHHVCPQYVCRRWLKKRPSNNDVAIREVRNHFFAQGNRALIRDNGLSRLWWLGKIASDVAPESPDVFLTILLHRQDVRSALIERPSVSMNTRVLKVIYEVMGEHWLNGSKLFEREKFRGWMRALNRRGGICLLDALPNETLINLVREEAEAALMQ